MPAAVGHNRRSMEVATESGEERRRTAGHWMFLVLSAGSVVGLVVLALFLEPDPRGVGTHEQLGLRACSTMELWNFPCPGCGVTTSATLALQGRFLESLRNQPFGIVAVLAVLAFFPFAFATHFRGRDVVDELVRIRASRWAIALLALMALAWLYKIWLVRG